jgi:hypothetical protein
MKSIIFTILCILVAIVIVPATRNQVRWYCGQNSEAAAQEGLREIREEGDVADLLNEKKIEIDATGNGLQKVSIRLRRLAPHWITVHIPVGTLFVPHSSALNMVTTAESEVRLMSEEWQSVSVDAAGANIPIFPGTDVVAGRIPESADTFTVQRSPHQAELAKIMPVMDRARVDLYTRQAAVWIVTANASLDTLGVLVRPGFAGANTRAITERETARAMKMLDEAGVDIKRKAVWRDRQRILTVLGAKVIGVDDLDDLRTWLEQKK